MSDILTRGFSLAGYSNWFFSKPYRTLFDCGEGVAIALKEEVFAIEDIFLTHGHLDHISGLASLLFARSFNKGDNDKLLRIFYPHGCDNIKYLIDYMRCILGESYPIAWIEIKEGESIKIRKDRFVQCFRTNHIKDQLTLGYQLCENRRKLKPEFSLLSQQEIAKIAISGRDVADNHVSAILTYSGDTMPIENYGRYPGGILIHESTFLRKEDIKYDGHSLLEDVLSRKFNFDKLILNHFSIRYSFDEIKEVLSKIRINIPLSFWYESAEFEHV